MQTDRRGRVTGRRFMGYVIGMELFWKIAIIGLCIGFVVQCVLILALFRYIGLILRRLPRLGPTLGQRAPAVTVSDVHGQQVVLGQAATRPRVMVFMSPDCASCGKLVGKLPAFARSHRDAAMVHVVTDADPDSAADAAPFNRALSNGSGVTLSHAPALIDTYDVPGTPYAVVVDRKAVVRATGYVNRIAEIETLLESAVDEEDGA